MNAFDTINAVKKFCKANSGDDQVWQGNKATYHWNLGKETDQGLLNGVVRKLAGIEASGNQIWVVAGSLKIAPNGDILRFTGLPKKLHNQVMSAREVHIDVKETVKV
jgi:hemolysin-activating ACP:hemolysin acyltransferase